jgi:hypothetical protein
MRLTNSFDNLHRFGAVPDTHTTPMQRDFQLQLAHHTRGREERKKERKKERKCVLLVYDPSWQKETIGLKAILKCI